MQCVTEFEIHILAQQSHTNILNTTTTIMITENSFYCFTYDLYILPF